MFPDVKGLRWVRLLVLETDSEAVPCPVHPGRAMPFLAVSPA